MAIAQNESSSENTIQTYQVHFGSKNRIKYMSALLAISPGCWFKTDSGGAGI